LWLPVHTNDRDQLDDVVRDAQRGDPWAMQELMRVLMPSLGRICGSIALADGDDALQETMIVVLRRLATLREPAAVRGWARSIAVREALRVARKRNRAVPLAALPEVPVAPVDATTTVAVHEVLDRLAPEQRAILVLRDAEGLSEADAAALLDVAPGTVKSRLHRAREAFARRWPS
jgi:RNA polymerase sigma-70 factor (ECF subfamily)